MTWLLDPELFFVGFPWNKKFSFRLTITPPWYGGILSSIAKLCSLIQVWITREHLLGKKGRAPPVVWRHLQWLINTNIRMVYNDCYNHKFTNYIYIYMYLNLDLSTPSDLSTTTRVFPWASFNYSCCWLQGARYGVINHSLSG